MADNPFTPSDEGIELDEAAVTRHLAPALEMVKTLSPQGQPGPGYAESIEVVVVEGSIYLTSTDPFAHLVEYGSVNNPAYAPLRRGAEASGLRLEESEQEATGLDLIV